MKNRSFQDISDTKQDSKKQVTQKRASDVYRIRTPNILNKISSKPLKKQTRKEVKLQLVVKDLRPETRDRDRTTG